MKKVHPAKRKILHGAGGATLEEALNQAVALYWENRPSR